jgi:hypothetical protein
MPGRAQLNRFRLRVRIRLKARDDNAGDFALDQPLDGVQKTGFIDAHQRNRFTAGARAAGAPDAMNVILRYIR